MKDLKKKKKKKTTGGGTSSSTTKTFLFALLLQITATERFSPSLLNCVFALFFPIIVKLYVFKARFTWSQEKAKEK
jgi:hypothetical protein